MPDYNLKAQVISEGLVSEVKQVNRALWAEYQLTTTGEIVKTKLDFATAIVKRSFYLSECPEKWLEASRVAHANFEQVSRLRDRISKMLDTSENCVFVTLTFTDAVLAETSAETRRRYVARWLKSQSARYVANIDFGEKKQREHYHAVVDARVEPKSWSYGACNVQAVKYSPESKSSVKMAKYVAKLTNHAIKATTKRCHLIYSRNV